MVQFLDWEGLWGKGLMGDLDSIFTTWMDWNGLEWAVMAFNGYFIPTHSNPFQSCWYFYQNHPLCHCNPFQPILTHSSPFRLIPTHSNPVDISIKIALNDISTHSSSFQPIPILLIFLSKSPFMSLQPIPIHSNQFQFILTHSNPIKVSKKIGCYDNSASLVIITH